LTDPIQHGASTRQKTLVPGEEVRYWSRSVFSGITDAKTGLEKARSKFSLWEEPLRAAYGEQHRLY